MSNLLPRQMKYFVSLTALKVVVLEATAWPLIKRSCVAILAIALLGLTASLPAQAERHSKYRAFTVTESTDYNLFQGEAAINNQGEIVYLKSAYSDSTGYTSNIFSTRRGQISFSVTNGAQYPDINDADEVVYGDGSFGFGPRLISDLRGDLGRGYMPRINEHGDVGFMDQESVFIRYDNGSQVQLATGNVGTRPIGLTSGGELYFSTYEGSILVPQLYLATVNSITKLTDFTSDGTENYTSFAANNSGVYVYARDFKVYDANGKVIWKGPATNVTDMNDFGDIVVTVGTPAVLPSGDNTVIYNVVLLTTRPHFYAGEFKRFRRGSK